tara:strand:- start:1041 stop:1391 length:351 start_codon:yes stop_codon:yes gene_type:complete
MVTETLKRGATLYIVDHHNEFTTAIHTHRLTADDALLMLQGLRFYENVYLNYASTKDLFKNDDTPSWCNQDCVVYMNYSTEGKWFEYEVGKHVPRWKALEAKPDLCEGEFHWHDIN